jgi:micrococcal nuclease
MGRVIPFRKSYRAARRGRNSGGFSPGGSTIFNLAALTFLGVWSWPSAFDPDEAAVALIAANSTDSEMAHFGVCYSGGGVNCVVDGDTFHYRGQKIRIADIDTPETHPARCAEEQRLGDAATARLRALLNAGPFSLESIDREEDVFGRKLRTVTRGGSSLGGQLVSEGLARHYDGGRQPWC